METSVYNEVFAKVAKEIKRITDGKEGLLKTELYTDRIHIQGDIKEVFAHLFLYKTAHGLYI